MRINRGQIQVFSISFLDVLSCALGAVIILFVVVPKSPATPRSRTKSFAAITSNKSVFENGE